ncbi:hypothetical protein NF27_BK00920 [Candidatus Jidaibacter acanthamoeba]|uniref:Fungal lipase-like domain-containing protein n=1 Tax=Candidatus Jidaibacter acanthamoebae TaxID=86105 RepID=A0A0C1N1A1_9RICK|nr:DUF2974 domain-containing protein [Candidatus Jidaibacter acanthamoeba]KIE06171.1 hypothetical protein NF27_BK00920 [Candidatus Jidaibacter acanthamoeba]
MFDRIAAKFSNIVYNDANPLYKDGGYLNLEGWELLESSKNRDENGYFGAAFGANNTIIIAHRGTEVGSLDDIKNDISIFYNKPLTQLPYALKFSKFVENKYNSIFSYLHTGHSLGGLLAEVVGLSLKQPVISFEAPGAYQAANAVLNDPDKIKGDNITTYFTDPNFINTHGKHIANNFYKVDYFTNPTGVELTDYIIYSVKQHSMENLMNQFDAETGKPINFKIVQNWPEGFEAGYKSYLDNNRLWQQKAVLDWEQNIIIESYTDPDTFEIVEIKLQDEYQGITEYKAELDSERTTAKKHIEGCLVVGFAKTFIYLTSTAFKKPFEESFFGKLLNKFSNLMAENFSSYIDVHENNTQNIAYQEAELLEEELPCCDILFSSSIDCDYC